MGRIGRESCRAATVMRTGSLTRVLLFFALLMWGIATASAERVDILVPSKSVWAYKADGSDQGTAWREANFDDSGWPSGPAELGYGDAADRRPEATSLPYGPDPNNRYITTYFRRSFRVANPREFESLKLRLNRDDGAVVYLNGTEVVRSNMPAGTIAYTTRASSAVNGASEDLFVEFTIPAGALQAGRNVLAVEVHQESPTSPDLSFDLELSGSHMVTRGPYLQNATPGSITVRWRTAVPRPSRVRYGTAPNALTNEVSSSTMKTEHEATITGLATDTTYLYSIGDDQFEFEGNDNEHWFRTLPAVGSVQPVRVWVLGDSGTGGDGTGRAERVRDAYTRSPLFRYNDVWLMLGDNAYDTGTDAEYQRAVFDTYAGLLKHTRLWSTIGNHESYTAGAVPYFTAFTLPQHGEAGGVASGTERYYSFNYANIHFICLDSMTSPRKAPSDMLTWLEQDLENTTQKWIIAFWHHPPYSKGSHDSDNRSFDPELVEMRENVVPLLEAHGVDLVLSGHSHNYERSYLIDGHYGTSSSFTNQMKKDAGSGREDGDGIYVKTAVPHAGAVYVVAGSSGKASSPIGRHPAMYSMINYVLGSVILDIDGNRLDAKFLSDSGEVKDYFTIQK